MNQKTILTLLTFVMFMMFGMTTESVGVIIAKVMKQFDLSMTQASAFQYSQMTAIALAGIFLGFLADKLGRKRSIVLGLVIFAAASYLFAAGNTFNFFVTLLAVSGVAIGIFKTGALALVGDITSTATEHTSIMNTVEGFFGIGAIGGTFIVSWLANQGLSWKYLYVIAGTICALLILAALAVKYPTVTKKGEEPIDLGRTMKMMGNPYALAFSFGIFLYVAVECAIYVWMPTLIENQTGFFAVYALTIFFVVRAIGRFGGAWMLARFDWTIVLTLFSLAILLCFAGSVWFGPRMAVFLLPLSGLFMSVVYPTLNSKGISCFEKSQHGAVAGVILFFTCASAALGPLAMGRVSDHFHDPKAGFVLATGFAAILFLGTLFNFLRKPASSRLSQLEQSEYAA